MAYSVRDYSADEVTITLGAILIEDGWDDGEFLSIVMNEVAFNAEHSTDGMVSRSRTNNQSATATIKLKNTSPSNQALSALHNLDLLDRNGAGIVTFFVRDKSSDGCMYEAEQCWITKAPDVSYDRTTTPREWEVYIPRLRRNDAGH